MDLTDIFLLLLQDFSLFYFAEMARTKTGLCLFFFLFFFFLSWTKDVRSSLPPLLLPSFPLLLEEEEVRRFLLPFPLLSYY